MAIINKTGQSTSITEGWRALDLFSNREEAIRHFVTYLNDDPPPEQILFFYGDGGNGKSLLLRYLREQCCKRLRAAEWGEMRELDEEAFVAKLQAAEKITVLPSAYLDFGMPPRAEDRPQEAFSALLMLRRTLSGHGITSRSMILPPYGISTRLSSSLRSG